MLATLSACRQNYSQLKRELVEIDSLSLNDADSARVRLRQVSKAMKQAPEDVARYYDLVKVKVKDRNHLKHNSDSVILKVAEYYERINDQAHMAEAFYYVGRANSDMHNGGKALLYFHRALLAVPENPSPRLMSRIFAQTGSIYLHNGLAEEAKQMQEMACFYCQQANDTLGVKSCTDNIQAIDSFIRTEVVDESVKEETRIRMQQIMEKAKNQQLSTQNRQMKNDYDKNTVWKWILMIVAIGAVPVILIARHRKNSRKNQNTTHTDARRFYDKKISSMIKEREREGRPLKDDDWDLISNSLNNAFPTFKDSLYSKYDFSDTEYRMCILIKMEVSPSSIARLMSMSTSSASQVRTRLQRKVNGAGSAKDWDTYILSL